MKVRINPDKGADAKRLQNRYKVRGYPTFLFVSPGKQPRRLSHGGAEPFSQGARSMRDQRVHGVLQKATQALQRRDAKTAIQQLTGLLNEKPRHASAWYRRGVAHRMAGDVERALADFMRALLVDREMARAWSQMAELSLEITRYAEAVQCAGEFIANASSADGGKPYELRARARVGTGDLKGALRDAKKGCRKGSAWSCDLVAGLTGG